MDPDYTPRQRRESFLTLFLTALGALFFLFVLILLTGGYLVYVLLIGGGLFGVGLLHYLLWGRLLSQQVAGEREEERLRRRAEEEDEPSQQDELPPGAFRRGTDGFREVGPRQALPMPYLVKIPGITEEMFEELVDEDLRAELLDRVLIVHSPATVRNDDLSGFLRSLLRLFAEDRGLGNVYGPDSIIHLASCRKFAPDLYFVRSDRVLTPRPKEFEG